MVDALVLDIPDLALFFCGTRVFNRQDDSIWQR